MTNTNRGAFLSDALQGVVKPIKRTELPQKIRTEDINVVSGTDSCQNNLQDSIKHNQSPSNKEKSQKKSLKNEVDKSSKTKDKHKSSRHKSKQEEAQSLTASKAPLKTLKAHTESEDSSKHKSKQEELRTSTDSRVPLKSLKPLTESEDSLSGKPFSKVEPLPPEKPKKKVHFSSEPPKVRVFEIEPGNKLKKTSLAKTSLLDVQHLPMFSLQKITLMKILRWNPHWLAEQINNPEPPPILGHHNPPMVVFQCFSSHNQYVQ